MTCVYVHLIQHVFTEMLRGLSRRQFSTKPLWSAARAKFFIHRINRFRGKCSAINNLVVGRAAEAAQCAARRESACLCGMRECVARSFAGLRGGERVDGSAGTHRAPQ